MTRPFWVDRGLSLEEIGAVLTTGRMIATVSGAVLGGYLTTRWGMRTALWSLGLLQAVSNLGYWAAAAVHAVKGPDDRGGAVREFLGRDGYGGVRGVPHVGVRTTIRRDAVRTALGTAGAHPRRGRARSRDRSPSASATPPSSSSRSCWPCRASRCCRSCRGRRRRRTRSARPLTEPAADRGLHQPLAVPGHQHGPGRRESRPRAADDRTARRGRSPARAPAVPRVTPR